MRSILVTVDDTPSAIAARGLGVALAQQHGAEVRGVTALDVGDLDRVEPIPVGGAQHAYDRLRRREKLATERRARIAELPALFRRSLADAGLRAVCSTLEADVRGGMLGMIETCDLVVTGRDVEFHFEPVAGVTPLVEYIIAKGCRAVVVCGPERVEGGPVLVAYDGSAPAAKALQLATQMGIFESAGAHVVAASRDRATAKAVAERAQAYLALHGVAADLDAVVSSHPVEILSTRASEIGARMLVMGAFGHRGFREILFGSTTRRLFDQIPVPLFIYH